MSETEDENAPILPKDHRNKVSCQYFWYMLHGKQFNSQTRPRILSLLVREWSHD